MCLQGREKGGEGKRTLGDGRELKPTTRNALKGRFNA